MDVTDWLRSLGLECYAANFRDNQVSADLLATLTSQDLQELGVDAVGHRRRLLDAITALRGESGPAGNQSAVPTGGSPDRDRAFASAAERRHITVLLCDLVGSTQLSTRLDPEDLRQLLHTYRASVVAAVTGQRGYVAKFLGDGVLAYFGWPNVDETHADSAVRAGLAAIEALRPQQLAVRIGIATGLVVVGDLIGAGASQEHPAIGETPNLAARLQAVAEPDTVVLSEATRAQLGRMFELEELGPFALKGFDKPVKAWGARGETGASSRSEAIYAGALTPLVGRDEELDLLLRRWRQAKSGEGRVVLLSGEAGIGKSRLLAALEEQLAGEPHVSLRYFCTPYQQDSPLHPIIARLEQEAGCSRGDAAEQRLAKLEAVMARTAPRPDDVPLIASLLSIPTGARYPALELSPRRRKERTFAALIHRLASFASREPVLILFEDAHWSDPTSLELLDAVVEQLPDLPVLLLVSFRADFSPPWFGRPGVSLMALSRLDRRGATALATQVATDHVLSSALLDRIVAQADGVPLFIEELTKAVLEGSELDAASASLAVPDTLQASIMARLDRLPIGKQVAQIGAVIGREFSHSLLVAVATMEEALLTRGVEELVTSGLLFRRGVPSETSYTFKHTLVHDVAYESQLRARRTHVHARLVATLEDDGEQTAPGLALLGYHCIQGGLFRKAGAYFRQAGNHLLERAAFLEIKTLLDRGLALLARRPNSADRRRLEADLLLALGSILQITQGIAGVEPVAVVERAVHLSRSVDDPDLLVSALMRRCFWRLARVELSLAWDDMVELKAATSSKNGRAILYGHSVAAAILFYRGRFVEARAEFGPAASGLTDSYPTGSSFDSLYLSVIIISSICLACLGQLDEAAGVVRQVSDRVYELTPYPQWIALCYLLIYASIISRSQPDIERYRNRIMLLSCEDDFPDLRQPWMFFDVRGGHVEQGLANWNSADIQDRLSVLSPFFHCWFAAMLDSVGHSEQALSVLRDGLERSNQSGVAWLDSEVHRRAGELLARGSQPNRRLATVSSRRARSVSRSRRRLGAVITWTSSSARVVPTAAQIPSRRRRTMCRASSAG